jgi:hypothetical protein
MKGKWQAVLTSVAAQVTAVTTGLALGFARFHRVNIEWVPLPFSGFVEWPIAGMSAVLLLAVEFFRYLSFASLRLRNPATPWLCLSLALLAALTIYVDPLVDYRGDITFMVGIYLILPWLLAIGPLVRSKSWLGVVAAVVFAGVLLSMLIENGCSLKSSSGFFSSVVS